MGKIPDIIHPSWHTYLQPLFDNPKMELIRTQVLTQAKFYPEPEHIFRVFEMPIDEIKVVILGQDPYFNGTAIGYAFAVDEKTPTPKSLQIIYSEVTRSDKENIHPFTYDDIKGWKTLHHWRHQGVFLLNTALTVELGKAGSHTGQWMWFIREVIQIISTQVNGRNFSAVKPVWLLWGAKAQSFLDYIANPYNGVRPKSETEAGYQLDIDLLKEMNVYFKAPHPAAEAYSTQYGTFSGCNHFNLCNEILKRKQQSIINW